MITYLRLGKMGRFANQMFEIAGTIGVAVKNNQSYAFPLWVNHDAIEKFGSDEDINVHKYFINQLPQVPEDIFFNEYGYFWGYRDLRLPSGNWNMDAHFQSQKYFSHCMNLVRYYFTMYDEVDYSHACAVHMRFGDYDDVYHPRPKESYYRKALENIPMDVDLLLFSDDIPLATAIMGKVTDRKYIPMEGGYLEDFKVMKRCKHFVIGNSSYSLMASMLGEHPDKIITAPRLWFGGHVELDTSDLYPENCIIL